MVILLEPQGFQPEILGGPKFFGDQASRFWGKIVNPKPERLLWGSGLLGFGAKPRTPNRNVYFLVWASKVSVQNRKPQPQKCEPQPQKYEPQPQNCEPQPRNCEPQIQNCEPQHQNLEPQPQNLEHQLRNLVPQPQNFEPQPQIIEKLVRSPAHQAQNYNYSVRGPLTVWFIVY